MSVRCAACQSDNLTPVTELDVSKSSLFLKFQKPSAGFFDIGGYVAVQGGRACLDCGHVMAFLTPKELARLRVELPKLAPIVK